MITYFQQEKLICINLRHSGVNISLGLDAMIETMGLQENNIKLWSVNDNASNMHVAIRESKYLLELNCCIHTLSLAVSDTFKQVSGMKKVLKKAKKLAKYAHNEGPKNQLKTAAKSANLKFRKPKCPGETRWSSQLDCMSSLQPYKGVIEALSVENREWEKRNLSKQEWKLLDGACANLRPLKETIKVWEGETEPTIDHVLERLYVNHPILDNFIFDPNNQREKSGILFAKKLKANLELRFPEKGTTCEIFQWANYLNPLYKGIHLVDEEKLKDVKEAMEEEWKREIVVEEESLAGANGGDENIELSPTSKLRLKLGTRIEYKRRKHTSAFRKETERYETFSTPTKNVSTLNWWKKVAPTLPILANFARSVLAIPASSAKSERVFSKGGNIVTRKRTRLNPKKVEEIVIIQENVKMVNNFLKKTSYDVKKTGVNGFAGIDIKEIVKHYDEEQYSQEEDSDDGAEAFESDEESKETVEYDTDFSDSDSE